MFPPQALQWLHTVFNRGSHRHNVQHLLFFYNSDFLDSPYYVNTKKILLEGNIQNELKQGDHKLYICQETIKEKKIILKIQNTA